MNSKDYEQCYRSVNSPQTVDDVDFVAKTLQKFKRKTRRMNTLSILIFLLFPYVIPANASHGLIRYPVEVTDSTTDKKIHSAKNYLKCVGIHTTIIY